jgi:hypothetical protein
MRRSEWRQPMASRVEMTPMSMKVLLVWLPSCTWAARTLGKALLATRSMEEEAHWRWRRWLAWFAMAGGGVGRWCWNLGKRSTRKWGLARHEEWPNGRANRRLAGGGVSSPQHWEERERERGGGPSPACQQQSADGSPVRWRRSVR